ncbi:hypothetical protein NG54_15375 [Heyndrickxia ginsengihumi]|uniref:Uncharacterized protein n=1 Tax=Heyndrickxia ginsengihumi TaxID=363870 RepID=A0A0A6VA55_9BACI|nr:hypothetical protein NG54_15375 [Heyndrickxia ginsengihumi]
MVGVNRWRGLVNPSLSRVLKQSEVGTFGTNPVINVKWKTLCFQFGWQRGSTLVPFLGREFFYGIKI